MNKAPSLVVLKKLASSKGMTLTHEDRVVRIWSSEDVWWMEVFFGGTGEVTSAEARRAIKAALEAL